MAWVFSANGRFADSFGEGAPLRTTPFSNDEFQAAAQMRHGVRLTCLISFTDLPLKSNNTRAPHFTPQHWLLCHMGLY